MGHTRRHGKVHHLPEEIQREVNSLLLEPDVTYEDIAGFLKDKGREISKSSIGRYGKDFLNQVRRLRQMEDKAKTLVSESGDGLVLEEAASKLFAEKIIDVLLAEGFNVKKLSYMLSDFARLQAASVRREKLKAELKGKVEKAVKDIEGKAKKELTPETLAYIKEVIYGLGK